MSDGYLADTGGFTYHRELNPVFQRFCLLANGFAAPQPREGSIHCELGFRQGVAINMHAAAQPAQFVGSDHSATRVAVAQALADVTGSGVRLLGDSFGQLLSRTDLPQFDSISLHGVWSSLSVQERQQIVTFIERQLRPGGVLYMAYDTMPGNGPQIALRKMLSLFNQMGHGTEGGEAGRVRAALEFMEKILAIHPAYNADAPLIVMLIDELKRADPHQVARQYFNPHWRPTYFVDLCQQLAAAQMDWTCTALPVRTIQALQAPPEHQRILASTTHPVPREQMQDFLSNHDTRADIFVRGARRLGSMEQRRQLMSMRFVLLRPLDEVKAALGLSADEAPADAALANWLEYLGRDQLAPKSPHGLLAAADEESWVNHMLMLLVLVGGGVAAPAQDEAATAATASRCAALNRHLLETSVSSDAITALVSPVLGGGVDGINRMQQLMLLARHRLGAASTPEQWARYVHDLMRAQGEYMLDVQGQPLGQEQHARHLDELASDFARRHLPVLQALQIA